MRTLGTGLVAVVFGMCCEAGLGCQAPPPGKVYEDRAETAGKPTKDPEFTATAHREAYARLIDDVVEPLRLSDPIAAAQIGRGKLAAAPLSLVERHALASALAPIWSRVGEIDETALAPEQVVVLRSLRFGLGRLHDEVERRPKVRMEPLTAVVALEELVGEIEFRLVQGECDEACGASLVGLSDTLISAHQQLGAASVASTLDAAKRARALAERLRGLAERSGTPSFVDAATALDAHANQLDVLTKGLSDAEVLEWSTIAPPLRDSVRRLPDPLGERALTRLFGVEERIDTPVAKLWALTRQHVSRWQRMRGEMVVADRLGDDPPLPLDLARCSAAQQRIAAGLGAIAEVDPAKLDCERWLKFRGQVAMSEGELVLALLDEGWIEPQRRRIRSEELPGLALVTGQWSAQVHRHLRRVMLLARLDEPHARARALDEGRAALCLASAALWIHGQVGPRDELRLMLGPACGMLGDAKAVEAMVLADPRGSLAGLGLALIGDEPAAMAGFDRFWWAPLGLMRLLATPTGVHPDVFRLPSEEAQASEDALEVEVKIEDLDPEAPLE